MISHVFVGVTDFDRAFKFYLAVMEEIGLTLKFCERYPYGRLDGGRRPAPAIPDRHAI